jgi:hypothetical protein
VTVNADKHLDGVYPASAWPDELKLSAVPHNEHMVTVELFGKKWQAFGSHKLIFLATCGEQVEHARLLSSGARVSI